MDGEWDDDGWDEGGEAEAVDAVYPTTRCYHCQGYGHMARECPRKGKGKGDMKGGGKCMTKGGYKGDGKGGGSKGGFKGDGKGGMGKRRRQWGQGFQGFWKGTQRGTKGGGKGFGYQGTCFRCGKVGHKSAECVVYMVGETAVESEGESGAVSGMGNPWVVGGVTEVSTCGHGCRSPKKM